MIVRMKKLSIVGIKAEKDRVMGVLRDTGCFELSKAREQVEGQTQGADSIDHKLCEEMHHRLNEVELAIELTDKAGRGYKETLKLSKANKEKLPKRPLFSYKEFFSASELRQIGERAEEIYASAIGIIKDTERAEEIEKQYELNTRAIASLGEYKQVEVALDDVRDTKNMLMRIGKLDKKEAKRVRESLAEQDDLTLKWYESKKQRILIILAPIERREEIESVLEANNFEACELASNLPPTEQIERLEEENIALVNEKQEILYNIAIDTERLADIKRYSDYLALELEMEEAKSNIYETKTTYIIEGWVPEETANEIIEKVKAATTLVECELREGEGDEIPPTLTRSNPLVSPYEAVTNMYSPPNPYERDPNVFVGIFFFIFFGIMIGDAIYGIALFAITFVLMRCYKMDTSFKKLMMILCMGGISAFIWGAVYNSWAAVGLPYNPILNPVDNPFDFLMITLGLGYLQITFGYLLKLIANIRARSWISALADSGWKLMIMIGGGINIPSMLSMFEKQFTLIKLPTVGSIMSIAGLILIGIGLVGMLITGGRHKTSIAGKIISGVGSWYDLVGLLSDILSYCRLFGLALSGAIIGMVANILAKDVLFDIPIFGYALGLAVAIFFHIFNLALACLGAYVHNSRLQFVEFFGKFYEGGGRQFHPLGWRK